MNEFDFINTVVPAKVSAPYILGMGDDCSVMEWTEDKYLLQSADCLIENVHFRLQDFSFEEIAYKALAVNISDVSAMGGTPLSVHLSLGVPSNISEENLIEFFKSFNNLAAKHNIQLVGGDLSSSPEHFFINVTITGEVEKTKIKWRQGLGKSGVLAVTGPLGDSGAGLHCLKHNTSNQKDLVKAHKYPPIELEKARWLSGRDEVQGMMDLSDGLMSDLSRVSSSQIAVDLDKIPLSGSVLSLASSLNKDPLEWALCGGEDYRLFINCKTEAWDDLASEFQKTFGTALFSIGVVDESKSSQVKYLKGGSSFEVPWSHFRHF